MPKNQKGSGCPVSRSPCGILSANAGKPDRSRRKSPPVEACYKSELPAGRKPKASWDNNSLWRFHRRRSWSVPAAAPRCPVTPERKINGPGDPFGPKQPAAFHNRLGPWSCLNYKPRDRGTKLKRLIRQSTSPSGCESKKQPEPGRLKTKKSLKQDHFSAKKPCHRFPPQSRSRRELPAENRVGSLKS